MLRLWCAGILCPHPELKRFHWSCFHCRWRRKWLNKWKVPPYWIDYTVPWTVEHYALINVQNGQVVQYRKNWQTIKIDPRGHFTALRCAIIVTLDKIMTRFKAGRKQLFEICEFFANYPTF